MTLAEQQRKKRSWTPYGVLAATIVLAFLIVCIPGGGPGRMALKVEASDEARQISIGCQGYKTEYGALPKTSENYRLIKILCGDNPKQIAFVYLKQWELNPNGEMIDPWGTPFRITFDPDSKIHIISAGPDKIFGTPDDIANQ